MQWVSLGSVAVAQIFRLTLTLPPHSYSFWHGTCLPFHSRLPCYSNTLPVCVDSLYAAPHSNNRVRTKEHTLSKNVPSTNKSLTPMQERLVHAVVVDGMTVTEAAKVAGYSSPSAAHNATRSDAVRQAMHALVLDQIANHAPRSLKAVADLMSSAKSEYVKLQAAQDLLDRAGYKPPEKNDLRVLGDIKVSIDLG